MNYEQKYKEALERAKKFNEEYIVCDPMKSDFESIFPELAETEDERIRKELVRIIGDCKHHPADKERWLAWLEKQKDICLFCDQHLKGYLAGRKVTEEEKQKEQKPAGRSLEDDHIIGFVFDLLNEIEWKDNWAMSKEECLRLLNNYIPQKPAEWSEEDSDNLERVDNYLWMLDNYIGDDCATPQGKSDKIRGNIHEVLSPWLKSLPERFNLQPKPSWSEEDERMLNSIIERGQAQLQWCDTGLKPEQVSWLKSFKPPTADVREEAYNKGYNDGIAANLADLEKEFGRGYDFAKKEMAEQKGKADKLPRYYGD